MTLYCKSDIVSLGGLKLFTTRCTIKCRWEIRFQSWAILNYVSPTPAMSPTLTPALRCPQATEHVIFYYCPTGTYVYACNSLCRATLVEPSTPLFQSTMQAQVVFYSDQPCLSRKLQSCAVKIVITDLEGFEIYNLLTTYKD